MWLLWVWITFVAYIKLVNYGFLRFDMIEYLKYFAYFMVAKNIFFTLLNRVFSFMRIRDWLKHRKWDKQKMEMEKQYYNHKYQAFLKQQELSNTNEIKEIEHEPRKFEQ